jgi:hypothetical protein
MSEFAYLLRYYSGIGNSINFKPFHIRLLNEVIPNVQAREKLESIRAITKDNIKTLVMLAYDDPKLAEKAENMYLLNSMEKPKR